MPKFSCPCCTVYFSLISFCVLSPPLSISTSLPLSLSLYYIVFSQSSLCHHYYKQIEVMLTLFSAFALLLTAISPFV